MLGLIIHREPNKHEVTFATLHAKLLKGISLPYLLAGAEDGRRLGSVSAAPFPFLPVPIQLRCPSKVACEGHAEEE